MRKRTIVPLKELKKEHIKILKLKMARLENYVSNMTTRMNSDSTSGIYLTAVKVSQWIMADENKRKNDETKKETGNKTAARKACLQQKRYKTFQKYQDCLYSLSPSPYEETMLIALVTLSSTTLEGACIHLGGNMYNLPNYRRPIAAMDIIRHLDVWVWNRVGTTTNIISPLYYLCRPSYEN